MVFNSLHIWMFTAIILIYFFLPHPSRWPFLLAASCLFYATWGPQYLVLLLISSLFTYIACRRMDALKTAWRRRLWLIVSLTVNFGMLAIFKYLGFMTVQSRFPIAPIGISIYTLQAAAYTIDVYRKKYAPEPNLGVFSLYLTFFPKMVFGPIDRPDHLIPQLKAHHKADYEDITEGLKLLTWGIFKKVVIAGRAAQIVDAVYNNPEKLAGPYYLIATIVFAFQIFCDISGYADIAIGAARVLGIRLTRNFARPYSAKSVADFWRRWNMTFSTWIRDYLYIPMGGSRTRLRNWAVNIFIVFMLCSLWYGIGWTFLVWGAIHALILIFGKLTLEFREKIWKKLKIESIRGVVSWVITFVFIVLSWVIFRANSLKDAWYILTHIFSGLSLQSLWETIEALGMTNLAIIVASVAGMEICQLISARLEETEETSADLPLMARWSGYILLVASILVLGVKYI